MRSRIRISEDTKGRLTIGFGLLVALAAYTVLVYTLGLSHQHRAVVNALDREAYAIELAKLAHERAAGRLGLERAELVACLVEAGQ